MAFQSTPSGGKATNRKARGIGNWLVSIHAFRGEGDDRARLTISQRQAFQSTPSGGKATDHEQENSAPTPGFQSTPSGGKATEIAECRNRMSRVSIHAFRGEGDMGFIYPLAPRNVSIHAFRGEGDQEAADLITSALSFQSTPSGGKATPASAAAASSGGKFQSTPSGGKATRSRRPVGPAAESFNPRLPGGRRPARRRTFARARAVSIHAFRGEGDSAISIICSQTVSFNPRLPGGRRPDMARPVRKP